MHVCVRLGVCHSCRYNTAEKSRRRRTRAPLGAFSLHTQTTVGRATAAAGSPASGESGRPTWLKFTCRHLPLARQASFVRDPCGFKARQENGGQRAPDNRPAEQAPTDTGNQEMKEGKEVKPNVPSIELTPKAHRCQTQHGEQKTKNTQRCEKTSSWLFTCHFGPFRDLKAPAPCLESETNEGKVEKLSGQILTSRNSFCWAKSMQGKERKNGKGEERMRRAHALQS